MGRLRSVLPEGSTRCRIRATAHESRDPKHRGSLLDTLGDETIGMVMVDPACISPMKYDQLKILDGIVGKSSVRITVEDALRHKSWHKVNAVVDTSGLDDQWRKDFTQGAQQLLKATWVTATDPHYARILARRIRE